MNQMKDFPDGSSSRFHQFTKIKKKQISTFKKKKKAKNFYWKQKTHFSKNDVTTETTML